MVGKYAVRFNYRIDAASQPAGSVTRAQRVTLEDVVFSGCLLGSCRSSGVGGDIVDERSVRIKPGKVTITFLGMDDGWHGRAELLL